jgi:diacylglycerol kinase
MATHQLLIAWLEGRKRSFAFAFQGLRFLMRERNAQIHFAATFVVVCLGAICQVSRLDWLCLIIAIMGVWVAEAFNTALEALANATVPEMHPLVKVAKDVAAGAVLLAALGAVCIAGLVFVPRMQYWLH